MVWKLKVNFSGPVQGGGHVGKWSHLGRLRWLTAAVLMARANDEDGEANFQVGGSGGSWFGFQAMPAKRDILFGFLKAKCKLCALELLNPLQ